MTPADDRWAQVDEIFSAALDEPPHRRAELVREATQGDAQLERDVLELLRAAEDEDFLGVPAISSPSGAWTPKEEPDDALVGTTLGAFRISRRVGRGGMASVYLAERTEEFEQQVAVKVLRRGMDTEDITRRFLTERQILAELDHPSIARVMDGGSTPDGRPYFVMEFVDGLPITRHADEHNLDVPARVELLCAVTDAVQYAHQRLVVHRDLKPSNVLVDSDGRVKLLDFGIARLIGPASDGSARTATGTRLLTPAYAAPEQLLERPVTTATDVYQIGALAYELLSGCRPFPEEETRLDDPRREPVPMAHAVRSSSQAPGALVRELSGDLGIIVSKALSSDVERRYPSVGALGADLRNVQRSLPISARRPSVGYRLRRFSQRHPWFPPVVVASAVGLALYLGSVERHQRELTVERNSAQAAAAESEAATAFLASVLGWADPWAGGQASDVTLAEVLDATEGRLEREFEEQPDVQARLQAVLAASHTSAGRFDDAERLWRRVVELRSEAAGPGSTDALDARTRLGRVIVDSRGPEHAGRYLDSVAEYVESLPEPDTRAVRLAEIAWAHAYARRAASDYEGAFSNYALADSLFGEASNGDPERYGALLADYSRVWREGGGEPGRAVALARRGVAMLSTVLPEDHFERLEAEVDLAGALNAAEEPEQALEVFDRVEPLFRAQLEVDHPSLLALLNNRALVLDRLGRPEDGLRQLQEIGSVLRTSERVTERQRADHDQNVAAVLEELGRADEAVAAAGRAFERYRALYGEAHHLVAFPLLTIAEVELERGRHRAALEAAGDAWEILSVTLPAGHFATAVAACRRGRARLGVGQSALGQADVSAARAALEDAGLPPEHPLREECG